MTSDYLFLILYSFVIHKPNATNCSLKAGVVTHALVSVTQQGELGGLWSQTSHGKSVKPYLKNKVKAKMYLGHDTRGKVLDCQEQIPKFNIQCHKKVKEKSPSSVFIISHNLSK
jgi:hypothetical protein